MKKPAWMRILHMITLTVLIGAGFAFGKSAGLVISGDKTSHVTDLLSSGLITETLLYDGDIPLILWGPAFIFLFCQLQLFKGKNQSSTNSGNYLAQARRPRLRGGRLKKLKGKNQFLACPSWGQAKEVQR